MEWLIGLMVAVVIGFAILRSKLKSMTPEQKVQKILDCLNKERKRCTFIVAAELAGVSSKDANSEGGIFNLLGRPRVETILVVRRNCELTGAFNENDLPPDFYKMECIRTVERFRQLFPDLGF